MQPHIQRSREEHTVILVCYEEDEQHLQQHNKNHFPAFTPVA